MIATDSGRYAVRAMIHLAEHGPGPLPATEIARAENIPPHYLAKILQDLSNRGLLHSTRGRGGGFTLSHPPQDIHIIEIVEAVENIRRLTEECILGLDACSDETPCPLHDTWNEFRTLVLESLNSLTLADLTTELERKRHLAAS